MKIGLKLILGFLIVAILVGVVALLPNYFQIGETRELQEIKIVTSFPMRKITVGQGIVNGIKLALEEVDYRVGNYKIELVVEDDGDETGQWQGYIEEEIANRVVADPDVMVYLGTYNSGAAKVSIPITNQGGLVQISPGNTWPGLTKPGFLPGEPGIFYPTGIRTYFRVCPIDTLQAPAGAVWAKDLGFKTVYVFDDGTESAGFGIANLFGEKARELGLVILGRDTLSNDNVEEKLEIIKTHNPDLVYYSGITPHGAVPLAKGVKELDIKFMGVDGIMEQAFIAQAGDAAEGTYVTVVGVPPEELAKLTEKGKEFVEKYKERYAIEPETFSAFGYEAAKVALLAIERVGAKDRAKILEEVSKIKNYNGLFGTWSFDQNGDTTLSLVSGTIVKNGEFAFETLLTP
jgi:branched-chain amino acid transport system substrate-binding protein